MGSMGGLGILGLMFWSTLRSMLFWRTVAPLHFMRMKEDYGMRIPWPKLVTHTLHLTLPLECHSAKSSVMSDLLRIGFPPVLDPLIRTCLIHVIPHTHLVLPYPFPLNLVEQYLFPIPNASNVRSTPHAYSILFVATIMGVPCARS